MYKSKSFCVIQYAFTFHVTTLLWLLHVTIYERMLQTLIRHTHALSTFNIICIEAGTNELCTTVKLLSVFSWWSSWIADLPKNHNYSGKFGLTFGILGLRITQPVRKSSNRGRAPNWTAVAELCQLCKTCPHVNNRL